MVRINDIIPHVESFMIRSQTKLCPPELIDILKHKIHADISKNPELREFHFPFPECPTNVTIEIIS